MKCAQCGFPVPDTYKEPTCIKCGGTLVITAEELLSNPAHGFVREIRPGQIELTKVIEEALRTPEHSEVFAEGGCGVGKTFAYGTPAVLSGKRVVICTAKKSLQDQLEMKDVPYLQKKLKVPKTFVSVKGKSNYVCARLVRKNEALFAQHGQTKLYDELIAWLESDTTGDLNAFPGELEFPATTCTAEECIGRCKVAKTCGYWQTKERMRDADLIITNHSLLGFDLRFGVGKLLGLYQVLVIDEAHAAPDFLRRAFAQEVSETWLKTFLRKLGREQIVMPDALDEAKVVPAWEKMFRLIPEERLLPANFLDPQLLADNCQTLRDMQEGLYRHTAMQWVTDLDLSAPGRPSFADLCKRAEENILNARDYSDRTIDDGDDDDDYEEFISLVKFYTKAEETFDTLQATVNDDSNYINCREVSPTGKVKILRQPVNLAPFVRGPLKLVDKVIFASATLNGALLKTELGVTPNVEICQPSPFNYKANGLVYIPQHLVRPNEEEWPFQVAQEVVQLIRASKGNGLVLFSAKHDLARVMEEITLNYDLEYPIFAQSDTRRPRDVMRSFEETPNSTIFGLRSFFEGIDIQGSKLRLVVLTKIPFPHMQDPLCQAKKEQLGQSQWWKGYYYPTMLTEVQQAAGRLIRTATDRGVLAVLDVRMWVGGNKNLDPRDVGTSKRPWSGYGYNIFRALPFENYTPRQALVLKFLEKLSSAD